MNSCSEIFINDIVHVDVYHALSVGVPLPPTVPMIKSLPLDNFPEPVLSFGYAAPLLVIEGSLVVKQTLRRSGQYPLYIYNVEATIDGDSQRATESVASMQTGDYCVVLTKQNGALLLLHQLPGSFSIESSGSSSEVPVKISLSALNDFIHIELNS